MPKSELLAQDPIRLAHRAHPSISLTFATLGKLVCACACVCVQQAAAAAAGPKINYSDLVKGFVILLTAAASVTPGRTCSSCLVRDATSCC